MLKPSDNVIIYIDFDGTISRSDVLNHLLDSFTKGKWLPIDKEYLEGKISSRECISRQVALMGHVPTGAMLRKAEEIGIDPTFKDFIQNCKKSNIETKILSDGLDFYIKQLLDKFGITDICIKSNRYIGSGRVEFPYHDESCRRGCGNCKKNHIRADSFSIYIGDGSSDFCAAAQCNLVFAKKSLAKHLGKQGLSFVPYNDFNDVSEGLKGKGLFC